MRKTWIYKRKDTKGWWVGWYESGCRKAKALLSKKLAEHFCQLKYTQLNSDVFTGMVNDKNCRKTWIYEGASGQGLCKTRCWEKDGPKNMAFRINLQESCLRKEKY